MGSLYRSEPMSLCQLFLQPEAAYSCLSELGEIGLLQFKDLNKDVNAFQRKYVNEVRRCEEMERKLRFLEKEVKKDGLVVLDTGDNPDAPAAREMTDLEAVLERLENEMKEINANSEALRRNFLDLTELRHILSKTHTFFEEVSHYQRSFDVPIIDPLSGVAEDIESVGLLRDENLLTQHRVAFGFIAGVILRDRLQSFERMLWRACRGNVLLRHTDIDTPLEDPITGSDVYKSVFLIFFQGDQLKSKVRKICEGFHGTVYPCPETQAERREMAMGVVTRIEDLKTVINQTEEHRYRVLYDTAANLRVWNIKVRKMKAIYHTLNQFQGGSPAGNNVGPVTSGQRSLIGECWCPDKYLDTIHQALRRGTERSGSGVAAILNRIDTKDAPPTFHETNKFTSVFQGIIDSYGVGSYLEVNPTPFTVITFPFLFSVMFGDAGHGVLVFLVALVMVLMEQRLIRNKSDDEMWNIFFGGRYIILLMGAFSIYSGLLYNDVFAKPINVFGSAWHLSANETIKSPEMQLSAAFSANLYNEPYPFGIDPAWQFASNKISFLNSFKMKISVIFGVSQMLFGIILSLQNHRYFNDTLSIVTEFIPQMIFLLSIFGYLIVLIVYKWFAFGDANSSKAPSLLIGLINMFLYNYSDKPDSTEIFYFGQKGFQTFLLLLIVICIPWLLLPKPLILKQRHKDRQSRRLTDRSKLITNEFEMQVGKSRISVQSGDIFLLDSDTTTTTTTTTTSEVTHNEQATTTTTTTHSEQEFDFGEVFVHQCIHTIEFCLGCISHTASYLRLWALSLAHAELSEVLWKMILHSGFTLIPNYGGSILLFLVFAPWAVLTVAILLLMEGLSAFLHTLRLHWVEFQSKFYKGEGYAFEPFSFEQCFVLSVDE